MDERRLVLEKIDKYGVDVYQDPKLFKFGLDAVCLAEFAKNYARNKKNYVDMCSGTGIVGILLSKMLNIEDPIFVEINPYFVEVNSLNLRHNSLDARVINTDIKYLDRYIAEGTVDFISINPPYMKANHGLKTRDKFIDLAKIEGDDNFLEDFFKIAFYLLKDKGQVFMVHRVERLVDIFSLARAIKMEPKTIQYIRNKNASKASLVLIRFVKNGGRFLENLNDYII
ncbi:MAG: methyltransferase [Tissierellia bacterium]|nr:methyltransferase [Tissierellia bacterium]